MNLTTSNISFSYTDEPVLRDISLDFQPGRFYSILGPNGCGKTTLLDLLVRHLKPEKGSIVLGDVPITGYTRKELARHMALVSQNYAINFPFSVLDVVMMGRHPHIPRFASPTSRDWERVNTTMEMTGILPFKNRKITDLSGGERQRCVLARALCQDTPILFLDEAFSNLDISHTLALLDIIQQQVAENGKTVISVFHDINLAAAWSDELVFMHNGTVGVSGETAKTFTEETLLRIFNVAVQISFNPYTCSLQASFKGRTDNA